MPCARGCCPTARDHWRSVNVSASATPTRRPGVTDIDAKERQWAKDHAAYRRLHREGKAPRHLDGSAELEARAATKEEITYGHLFTKDEISQVKEGMAMAQELYGEAS